MNLVNPAALFLAGLAVPIVVFYILKIRLRRVPVSTLLFWQQIFEEKKPRSLWQRLRHLLSLLLQLAFLALLVFALADPIFRWQQARARRLVLVVDNSASMNASDVAAEPARGGQGRGPPADRRHAAGRRAGDHRRGAAAAGRLRADRPPAHPARGARLDRAERRTDPRRRGRRAGAGGSSPAPRRSRRVVVLTDGGFDGAAELARQEDVELIAMGKKTGNVGITRLQARRSLLDPIGYEILVEVANASDEPVSCRLELDLDDDPIDVVPLTLAAGERTVQVFEKTSAEGGRLRATIDRADALPADNTAWAILPAAPARR